MSERSKHLFRFTALRIADAAKGEADYHENRMNFWRDELEAATAIVEKTASVTVRRMQVTGGWQPEVVVYYGDPAAYQRMGQAGRKIQTHTAARDRFRSDADLYTTQGGRDYDLDGEDVAHFRFNGRQRDE